MNKAILVGRLTRDPEVRYLQTGKVVASFTLAIDRRFCGENGQKEADFIPCVAWGKTAEVIGNNLTKGRKIGVDGRIQVRSYDDKEGVKRYVTEIVVNEMEFMDSRQAGEGAPNGNDAGAFGKEVGPEGDIPF